MVTPTKNLAKLGMPTGTAYARLKRKLFWSLLEETGRDKCFRCSKKMSEYNWSIEHKVAWLNDPSPLLFWDLANISYSHLKCNVAAKTSLGWQNKPKPIVNNEAWCYGHQKYESVSKFSVDKQRVIGLHGECKESRKDRRALSGAKVAQSLS